MKRILFAGLTGILIMGLFFNLVYAKSDSNNKGISGKVGMEEGKKIASNAVATFANKEEIKNKVNEFKEKIKENNGWFEFEGNTIQIKEQTKDKKEILAGKINAKTGLNLTAEDIGDGKIGQILRAYLSNGRYAIVKIMPDSASEKALKILGAKCLDRNCTVELKEVGKGNKTRLAYEIETEKNSTILLFFKKKMKVGAQVDAETGEIIFIKKPWWSFIAKEKDDSDDEIDEELGLKNKTKEEKVLLCHIPPGNPSGAHKISVASSAVQAHLAHGDYYGECIVGNSSCASQGEKYSAVYKEYPEQCCGDLTEWGSGMDTRISVADTCYNTSLVAGSPIGTCLDCGNGVCDGKENPCNCANDCTGKSKSNYNTIESFCNSTSYTQNCGNNETSDLCNLCLNYQ